MPTDEEVEKEYGVKVEREKNKRIGFLKYRSFHFCKENAKWKGECKACGAILKAKTKNEMIGLIDEHCNKKGCEMPKIFQMLP